MATRFTCRSIIPLFVVALLTGTVPVAAQEAADVATETLFEVTFAADDLPAGEVEAVYYRLTLPPGTGLPLLAGPFCGCPGEEVAAGVGTELVQSGSYALRLGAPFVVRRAGQDGEERVAPDTAVTLGPGDAAIYPDYAAPGEVRNAGQEPLVVVGVAIVSAEPSGTPVPDLPSGVRAEELAALIPHDWAGIAGGGPATVTLRRLTLPPGGTLPPSEPTGLDAIHVTAGAIEFNTIRPGETAPSGSPLSYREGRTVSFLPLRAGTRRTIQSVGDEPAVLLVLSIAPAGTEPGTPAAGTPTA